MKSLFLFAVLSTSLVFTSVLKAQGDCPLMMQKRLLLSDKSPLPENNLQESGSSKSNSAPVNRGN